MNISNNLPNIYYIRGNFFVYTKDDALKLRKRRILGQLVGSSPVSPHQIAASGFPYLINHYYVSVIAFKRIANFLKLVDKEKTDVKDNELRFSEKLDGLAEISERDFLNKRHCELEKRGIEPTEKRIGHFDRSKFKIIVPSAPCKDLSSYDIEMNSYDVIKILNLDECKSFAFKDLYDKGFYISSGIKFGSDFLIYSGDPIRYHAEYAVRVFLSRDESIDTSKIHYNELNCLNRLCHTANKTVLLGAVYRDINNYLRIKYWTIKSRKILEPDCDSLSFDSINPVEYVKSMKKVRDWIDSSFNKVARS